MEKEPNIPSRAIVLVRSGHGVVLFSHGTALDYYTECAGIDDFVRELLEDNPADGIYAWSGHLNGSTDYWGEHDEWWEHDEWRLLTEDEWKAFASNDEQIPWDDSAALEAHFVWQCARDAEYAVSGDRIAALERELGEIKQKYQDVLATLQSTEEQRT